jgi:hypothetical protein
MKRARLRAALRRYVAASFAWVERFAWFTEPKLAEGERRVACHRSSFIAGGPPSRLRRYGGQPPRES